MTSKSLFFKYMKENTKQRLWSVALMSLLSFFLFPVVTALGVSISFDSPNVPRDLTGTADVAKAKEQLIESMLNWCSIQNPALVFIFIVSAVVLGASGFAYLHSKKKTDFYHSIPVGREMLYTAACLNGILYMAVPYLVFLVISGIILQIKAGPFSWGMILLSYAQHMCFFTLVYMTVVIAMLLTGNTIVGILGTGVLFLWGPGTGVVITAYFSEFFSTFYDNGDFLLKWYEHSSPVFYYVTGIISNNPTRLAIGALMAAIVLFGLGMFIYKKRSSESAGRAMAFQISEPIIRFLLVIPITLFSGLIFRTIMYDDFWMVFGLVCGILISSCLIEIIYNFDFKSLFAHKSQLAFSAAAVMAVFLGFRFDITGYDSYLPNADSIEYAGIYCDSLDNDSVWMYHTVPTLNKNEDRIEFNWASLANVADKIHISDEEGIRTLREIAEHEINGNISDQYWTDDESEDNIVFDTVLLAWHLKSGKTVYRNYRTVNMTKLQDKLDLIYDNESYKIGMYPVLSLKADDVACVNYKLSEPDNRDKSQNMDAEDEISDDENTEGDTVTYDVYGDPEPRQLNLPDEATKAELLLAYQKELKSLTAKERRESETVARIRFRTNEEQQMLDTVRKNDGYYDNFDQNDYYPVFASFTETIKILKQCGIM